MVCDNCGDDSETFLILQEGPGQERRLCRDCAERLGYLGATTAATSEGGSTAASADPASAASASAASASAASASYDAGGGSAGRLGAASEGRDDETDDEKSCSRCGLTASEISREGRLGCALCVTVFRRELAGLWRRGGRAQPYAGKAPGMSAGAGEARRLHEALANAIQNEDFERAATLRDRLREVEAGESS